MNLNIEKILNKQFKIDLKGYKMREVDAFLDAVIEDYNKFQKIIKEKDKQINELTVINNKQNEELKIKQAHLSDIRKQVEILENKGLSNMDLLKRINKLEEKKS